MTLIVITGPTGVGKTELCLRLAEHFGCDIINADSRQIYAEIPIGTAAPTKEQMARVKHYFVGTKHIGEYYSASMYEQEVLQKIGDVEKGIRDTMPEQQNPRNSEVQILTGGSMMYIDAVCNGIDDIPTIREEVRENIKKRLETEGLEALAEELREKDPEYWTIVDRHNPRRVVHALEIIEQSGKTYTSFRTRGSIKSVAASLSESGQLGASSQRPFKIIKIGLTRDKVAKVKRGQVIMDHSELYERINARVVQMMEDGLEDEARRMLPYREDKAFNTIGYKELFQYFDGMLDRDEAIRQIQSNSREYARKQLTWFKKDKEVTWFHPDDIKNINQFINDRITT